MPLEDLEHIAQAAADHGFWIISDEIYSRLDFDGQGVPSITALPGMLERTIIVDGFSKTYAMTGWRLGYGIMPESLALRVELLLTHSIGFTATFTQFAGIQALAADQEMVSIMVEDYKQRRERLVSGLNAIPGISCQVPILGNMVKVISGYVLPLQTKRSIPLWNNLIDFSPLISSRPRDHPR